MDEAGKLLGASSWRSFVKVNLPLLRPALLAAALLVSIDVIKELLHVFRLAVLVVDIERMLVGVDNHEWGGHPQNAFRVLVTNHVVELSIDGMLD